MNFKIQFLIIGWVICFPFTLVGQVKIKTEPSVKLEVDTQEGVIYQLQRKDATIWNDVGMAVTGSGDTHTWMEQKGEYRVMIPSNKWVKVWADEFDGKNLNFSKWEKVENNYGGGNNERQAYRTEDKYCFVKGGHLNIAVYRDPHTTSDGKTQPYSSARIRSLKRGDWKYGKFEIRAKVPNGQGIWPAVWMLPSQQKYGIWAASGEIDILESRGSAVEETTGAIHFGGKWPNNKYLSHRYPLPNNTTSEAFHTYKIEWNKEQIKWYVDDQLCQLRKKEEWFSDGAKTNASAPFDQLFHLIINVAVDGRFFEKTKQKVDLLPASAFPQVLKIDFVRVYQWVE